MSKEDRMPLDEEINNIFRSVYQRQITLKPKAFLQIREFMKRNAQELVNQALRRAVRREGSLATVEVGDMLWAIDREKYRLKVGKSLVTAENFSEFGERKAMTNYNVEEEQYDDEQK